MTGERKRRAFWSMADDAWGWNRCVLQPPSPPLSHTHSLRHVLAAKAAKYQVQLSLTLNSKVKLIKLFGRAMRKKEEEEEK